MKNRNGLIVDAMLTTADGMAERDAAVLMLHRRWRRNRRWAPNRVITVAADNSAAVRARSMMAIAAGISIAHINTELKT